MLTSIKEKNRYILVIREEDGCSILQNYPYNRIVLKSSWLHTATVKRSPLSLIVWLSMVTHDPFL